jgi:Zn-dependent alcohol dehydrogenase
MAGATTIIGVDINPAKFELATKLGMTGSLNPKEPVPIFAAAGSEGKWC